MLGISIGGIRALKIKTEIKQIMVYGLQESTMYEQERQPFAMHFDAPMTEEMLTWL